MTEFSVMVIMFPYLTILLCRDSCNALLHKLPCCPHNLAHHTRVHHPSGLMHSPWHSHLHWFHCGQHPRPLEHVPTLILSHETHHTTHSSPVQVRTPSEPEPDPRFGSYRFRFGVHKIPELNPKSGSGFRKIYPEPN